jgi:CheY-like chemotaxis protein
VRLEDLTADQIRLALRIYRQLAWPSGAGGPRLDTAAIEHAATRDEALSAFARGDPGDDPDSRRYTLRLGNERYPFMKFVLQEHLVADEFCFSVDTHDNLQLRPDAPDHAQWEELKVHNRELKERIEAAWEAADLPTHRDLLAVLAQLARHEREARKRRRLLLVDDEVLVSRGLERLLCARGYDVDLVHDGAAALDHLHRGPLPDLVVLDYEMPGIDGREVIERMRSEARTVGIPVLLATAAAIDLSQLREVDGLLHKPYPREALFELIAALLTAHPPRAVGESPPV